MGIELRYRVYTAQNEFLLESTVWLPNSKVPVAALIKVFERQIFSSLKYSSLPSSSSKESSSLRLRHNDVELEASQIIIECGLKNNSVIDVNIVSGTLHKPTKNWGYGMTCAGTSSRSNSTKGDHFGEVEEVPVGTWWRYRAQASEAGVHSPLVASLHGSPEIGVYSLMFAATFPDDADLGSKLYFTGSGGRESGKRTSKKIVRDQTLTGLNKALAMNCATQFKPETAGSAGESWQKGLPIRVLRNGNGRTKNSKYVPQIGVRYDGLYKVVKYWSETSTAGFKIWRFQLQRDDPSPEPWSEKGRYQRRKLGFETPIYPVRWNRSLAGQRELRVDSKLRTKPTSEPVPDFVIDLMRSCRIWNKLLKFKNSKQTFERALRKEFVCGLCRKFPLQRPLTSEEICEIHHTFCEACLEPLLPIERCPVCPTTSTTLNSPQKNVNFERNKVLEEILVQMKII